MNRTAGSKIQKIEEFRVVKSQEAMATPESSRKSFAYPSNVSRSLNLTSLARSSSNLELYSCSAFWMVEECVGMRLAYAARYSQPNRDAAEKILNCQAGDEKQGGGAIVGSSVGFCVAAVRLPEIVEKRQAQAGIYIFADQAAGGGIRMVA